MSLGHPDLYIAGQKMQTLKKDPNPALAGLRLKWGTDDAYTIPPAATLTGQILVKGAPPSYLDVGAPVGLVDPVSSRCLFAGFLEPLTAAPEERIAGAARISFTAAAPVSELEKARVLDMDWTHNESAAARRSRLATAIPRGWTLNGTAGYEWIGQGRQKYQSVGFLTLLDRYVRGQLQRYNDTSAYIPGAGLTKRLTISPERPLVPDFPGDTAAGSRGKYYAISSGDGVAALPAAAISRDIHWEKTPADVITDVQVTSFGGAFPTGDESEEFEYLMDVYVDNRDLQNRFGLRSLRVETALSSYNPDATAEAIRRIARYWLNTQTDWRPTNLQLPDSRLLDTAPLLNLLAVDTRGRAGVMVARPPGALAPIRAFVLGGDAEWTGKKWTANLTLGRTAQ